MSSEGPKPYPVVYDAPSGAIQYSFQSGYITIPEGSVNAITALTGDVTATGPGSAAATISAGAVTTSKIATGAITATLIAAGAVKPAAISTLNTDNFTFPNNVTITGIQLSVGLTTTGNALLEVGGSLAGTAEITVKAEDTAQTVVNLATNSNAGWDIVKQGSGASHRLDITDAANNIPIMTCYQGGGSVMTLVTTTQKNAIVSPVEGLMVYDTTLHAPCWYNGTTWQTVAHV